MMAPQAKIDAPPSRVLRQTWPWVALGLGWCTIALPVWGALLRHAYQPAATGEVVVGWPAGARPEPPWPGCRVVVFAHPFCPCTRATLGKLDESLRRIPGGTSVRVVFVTAGLSPAEVSESRLIAIARELPGVDVRFDDSGSEARRFGARISGEVVAFDRAGRRIFHGGLTAARGHEGESAPQQLLERLLCGRSGESYAAPVYGCALLAGAGAAVDAPSGANDGKHVSVEDRRLPVAAGSLAQ